ncbi:hypothetical protein STCU_11932 [Strigomonas culicis]|uniref:Uncharacterized protein n=1 Tax=Strigomonas culicis TaxID=28005 RepID=S9ULK1_9TRYP|nr:hypothetical protein STCU_11932 [Strigomonas culicis]|eukprot:EPY15556.1 hypothetical protein STCU_11932 [Strigomonas culicis]
MSMEHPLQVTEVASLDNMQYVSGETTHATTSAAAMRSPNVKNSALIDFQADLELLVRANRRLEKENAEMRQQLQAMMLDQQAPLL